MKVARQLAQERLVEAQNVQRTRYDPKHGEAGKFQLGELVLIRMEFVTRGRKKSISPRYSRIAKVVGISPGNVYKVQLGPRTFSWINVERLKRYHPSDEEWKSLEPWLTSVDTRNQQTHVVEEEDVEEDKVVGRNGDVGEDVDAE
jgi:hypothetical protein